MTSQQLCLFPRDHLAPGVAGRAAANLPAVTALDQDSSTSASRRGGLVEGGVLFMVGLAAPHPLPTRGQPQRPSPAVTPKLSLSTSKCPQGRTAMTEPTLFSQKRSLRPPTRGARRGQGAAVVTVCESSSQSRRPGRPHSQDTNGGGGFLNPRPRSQLSP